MGEEQSKITKELNSPLPLLAVLLVHWILATSSSPAEPCITSTQSQLRQTCFSATGICMRQPHIQDKEREEMGKLQQRRE